MENSIPCRGDIVWFSCCTNGKRILDRDIKNHMFLILTKTDYNKKSDHFCGLPITSKKEGIYQEFLLNYGFDITNDDITGNLKFEKPSYLLCDRPVRLHKKDLSNNQKNTAKMKKNKLNAPISKIFRFLSKGKID